MANALTWTWGLVAFRDFLVLLGTATLAYSFGLRHAFDADHIAAIDNVTRKLMQDGQRPVRVGLFFSLGHSTVVLATVGIAATASAFSDQLAAMHAIGTAVSSLFLLLIAGANISVLMTIRRDLARMRAGDRIEADEMELLFSGSGLISRLLRPMFRLIRRSWHMYPLGLLFGPGFDTATEVGLLGISAASASNGLPITSILVFPALFTAGIALMDMLDSVLMLGAYGWAFEKPIRKLYYNMMITLVSVVVALLVGGIEVLGLIAARLQLAGAVWDGIGALNDNFGTIGFVIIGVFMLSWAASIVIYRLHGYDAKES